MPVLRCECATKYGAGKSLCEREALTYDRRVKIQMSVALEPDLDERIRASADRAGKSPADWFADAAEAKLRAEEDAAAIEEAARRKRHQALGDYLDEWEAEHGAFTGEELAATAEKLGWPWPPEGKAAR
jgi:predicted DNA-binding protein